jgi:hypothetical protein
MTIPMTTEDRKSAEQPRPELGSKWLAVSGDTFTIRALYSPNEEDDLWVEYTSDQGLYSCRLAAFLARFTALVQ